jgi:hypothetical protein
METNQGVGHPHSLLGPLGVDRTVIVVVVIAVSPGALKQDEGRSSGGIFPSRWRGRSRSEMAVFPKQYLSTAPREGPILCG